MEVVTEAEQREIIEWANENYISFQPNGRFRQFKVMDQTSDVPSCIWDIKRRIVEQEQLQKAEQEPLHKDLITYIVEGGQIHPHTEINRNGLISTRFVVFIQLPESGGLPTIDGAVVPVVERQYMRFNSGIGVHSSQVVEGAKARILLSFGFLLPPPN